MIKTFFIALINVVKITDLKEAAAKPKQKAAPIA